MVSARGEYNPVTQSAGGGISTSTEELLIVIAAVGALGFLAYNTVKPKEGECWFFDIPCQAGKVLKDAGKGTGDIYNYIVKKDADIIKYTEERIEDVVETGKDVIDYITKKDLDILFAIGEGAGNIWEDVETAAGGVAKTAGDVIKTGEGGFDYVLKKDCAILKAIPFIGGLIPCSSEG